MGYTDSDYLGTNILQNILDVAELALTSPVNRSYVAHGQPVLDCKDQLTVHADPLRSSNPLTRLDIGPQHCAVIPVIVAVVTITRCMPTGAPPDAAALGEASKLMLRDAWELWRGLVDAALGGTLVNSLGCDAFTFRDFRPIGPSGDVAAWQLTVEVSLT